MVFHATCLLLEASPIPGTPAGDLYQLFHFQQAWAGLQAFQSHLGTATSGPLGAMVLSFVLSLAWAWVKNRFETWSFWDVFLRLALTAAGIAAWNSLFFMVDDAMDWIGSGGGLLDPYADFYNLCYSPFQDLTINGIPWGAILAPGTFALGAVLVAAIQGLLELLAIAVFGVSIVGQHLTVMLCYAIGPLFLACYAFDPLQDLWMRWLRFYLTIKVWGLVMNFTLFIYGNAAGSTIKADISNCATWIMPAAYLVLMILSLGASLPIARALTGSAGVPFMNGSSVVGASVAAAGTAAAVTGLAVGGAIGGPVGATAGSTLGGGAGSAASAASKRS